MYGDKTLSRVFLCLLITLCVFVSAYGQNSYRRQKLPSNRQIRHRRHKMLQIEDISDALLVELDTSCISQGFVKAPNIENGKVVRYSQKTVPFKDQTKETEKQKKFLIATYGCSKGYSFEVDGPLKMYCSKRKWVGKQPLCIKIHSDLEKSPEKFALSLDRCPLEFSERCEHDCVIERGEPTCICHEGFSMEEEKCLDINECKVIENINDVCKFGCINTHGSYYCIKQSVSKDNSPSNPKRDVKNDDSEGSGSGDSTEEQYIESNNANEDDEDYVGKNHKQVQTEHETIATTTPISSSTTLHIVEKINATIDTETDEIHFAKEPNKKDPDYYYEEYDYSESDKNSENSVTSKEKDYKETDAAKNENTETLLTTHGFDPAVKSHGGVTIQYETSIPTSSKNAKINPISGPTEHTIVNSNIPDIKSTEEGILTTSMPKYMSPLPDEQENNQNNFISSYPETNTDNNTSTHRSTVEDNESELTERQSTQTKILHTTTEQRKEVTTIHEEENFVHNEEKATPQVIDDYDYVTTTLRTPILQTDSTTIFNLNTNTFITDSQNLYDYDYKDDNDNKAEDKFKMEEATKHNLNENDLNKIASVENSGHYNFKSETTPNTSTAGAPVDFPPPTNSISDKNDDFDETNRREDEVFKVTIPSSIPVTVNPPQSNTGHAAPDDGFKNDYDYNEEDYYIKPQTTQTINSTPSTSPSPAIVKNRLGNNNKKEKEYDETEEEYEEYEDYKETNSKSESTKNQDKETNSGGHHESKEIDGHLQECSTGFKLDENANCVDVNECEENTSNCSHECENTIGSYRCLCPLGSGLSSSSLHLCEELDPCLDHPCSHICINKIGSFSCECPPNHYLFNQTTCLEINCSHDHIKTSNGIQCLCPTGFYLHDDSYTCENFNECTNEQNNNCSQFCENTYGSYRCFCKEGYQLEDDGYLCKKGNHCEAHSCEHVCNSNIDSYKCSCHSGYYLMQDEHSCADLNECEGFNDCSQVCFNKAGGYECDCFDGFQLSEDGFHCEDENECIDNNGGCSHLCVNTNGSLYCQCPHGFILADKKKCVLEDPCSAENGGCSDICVNVNGQAECSCPENFELKDKTCFVINGCELDNGGCSHVCGVNPNGSLYCECPEGFILADKISCVLEDPCSTENGGCSDTCSNVNGQAECSCPENFELRDKTCFLINGCQVDNGGCSHVCGVNANGSVYCECPEGFILADNKMCIEENPCRIENGGCSDTCSNVNGQAECSCPEHFELKDKTCFLINGCEVDNGGCSHVCEISGGQVECSCPSTHSLIDGRICKEIDLCADNNGGCSHECTVFEGEVVCSCHIGYEIVENECLKINLCNLDNGNCSHTCRFADDQVECSCPEHYKLLNSTNCVKVEICSSNNGGCSHTCSDTDDGVTCTCPKNYKLTHGKLCVETNPCLFNNGGCSHECLYNDKKVNCLCPPGYNLVGKSCNPSDPCQFQNGGCSHECVNINGEAFCRCPTGFKLFNRHCFKLNPCSLNNGGCAHHCTNVNGEAKCSCYPGYVLENKACRKQNPCSINNGGCSHVCTATEGMPKCSCPSGYILRPNRKLCKEINECKINNGGCSHGCRNLPGSHECTCHTGYKLDQTNRTCVDFDECEINNGGCQHTCRNYPGGFRCECREGHFLQGDRRKCKPKVAAECLVPQAPKNGRVRCLQVDPNSTYVSVGTQCVIWCDYGHILHGHTLTTCNSLGNWDAPVSECEVASCPKLGSVANGYFSPSLCMTRNLFPAEICDLKCQPGYKPSQNLKTLTCLSNFQWSSNVDEVDLSRACTQESRSLVPFIKCPSNGFLSFTLPQGKSSMLITIPQPQTNVDWWQHVSSKPSWGMRLQNYLPPGRTAIIYSARTPTNNLTVSCRLIINVVDKEIPEVYNCPSNIEQKLEANQYSLVIHWSEPTFRDNVEVVGVYKSRESGTRFRLGTHDVNYVARDEAGNQARCRFTVTIKGSDVRENRSIPFRAILICPHGIQYMDKSPEEYDNEALKRQGCHWSNTRSKRPVNQHSYLTKSRSNQEDQAPRYSNKEYHPLSLYNQCC